MAVRRQKSLKIMVLMGWISPKNVTWLKYVKTGNPGNEEHDMENKHRFRRTI